MTKNLFLAGNNNIAKKPEVREKLRLSALNQHKNGNANFGFKKGYTPWNKNKRGYKNKPLSEKGKKNISLSLICKPSSFKGMHHSEETKKSLSLSHKGKPTWNKGKRLTLTHKNKSSYTKKKNFILGITIPHFRNNHTINNGRKQTEDWKRKKNEAQRLTRSDPMWAEIFFMKLLERPTSYEKRISYLCIEYMLPFIYTGNGTFLIGTKNPDFIHKTEKIALEVYTDYFKIRDCGSVENYKKLRSEYFIAYGYKTIFIGDDIMTKENWKELCLIEISKCIGVAA